MKTMYFVDARYGEDIRAIDVVKKTKCYAFYERDYFGKKELAKKPIERMFGTWAEAKKDLLKREFSRLDVYAGEVTRTEARIKRIQAMEEP